MRSLPLLAALVPLLVACGAETIDPLTAEDPVNGAAEGSAPPEGAGGSGAATASEPGAAGGAAAAPSALPACLAMPACNGAGGPTLGAKRPWKSALSQLTSRADPNHRGRDRVIAEGSPQTILGKFTYSLADIAIRGEEVDVFVERGCAGAWEKLGTTTTTNPGDHAAVDGVADSGGRVYFDVPAAKALAAGRHRVRMVVAADATFADAVIDVIPSGTPIFVSDVDGTLTETETAEWRALFEGEDSPAHPKAADALSALAAKGVRPVYLTARPEWLSGRTRSFLQNAGFPPGIVITTAGVTGATGESARQFKTEALARLAAEGASIRWAIGDTTTDAEAYEAAEIQPVDHRVFLRLSDSFGGRRIEAYSELLPLASASPATCK